MRKVIAAMNMTLDGFCDHTLGIADDEIHEHYADLLRKAGVILYGRTTFQLMEYWPTIVKNPTGNRSTDGFARIMDNIPKIVFSNTLKTVEWETARVAARNLQEEIQDLKQQPGKDILIGSPSLIAAATNLHLIDEYQLNILPTIAGNGLILFKNISDLVNLKLLKTKSFRCGAVLHYYQVVKK